jgi:rare lipoprotein A
LRITILAFLSAVVLILNTAMPTSAGVMTASWYGEELEGNITASGEPYRADGMTAAHKSLPLGTRLAVCKDECAQVRVNDRGPFTPGRDLDLSKAAAHKIGVEGVEEVQVEQTSSQPVTELPKTGE